MIGPRYRAARTRGLQRQKAVKTGANWNPPQAGARMPIASDTTYPAVISSDTLVAAGTGAVTLTGSITWNRSGAWARAYIRVNGTQVATIVNSTSTPVTSTSTPVARTINDGDTIDLWVERITTANEIISGYIDMIPT